MRGEAGFPVRLRFTKRGKVRFVSHRDVARALERAFRIEQLPLAFTQGFSPRPKVSFGLALSVGHESDAEYLDLELANECQVEAFPARLTDALPDGIAVTAATPLMARAPALQEAVSSVEYELVLADMELDRLSDTIERARASTEMPVETTRKGTKITHDVRPSIIRIGVTDDGSIDLEVATKPRGARPAEVIDALRTLAGASMPDAEDRVLRTNQWIERDGERLDPVVADRRASAQALEVCAK
jgi:radical SAM-linked protein